MSRIVMLDMADKDFAEKLAAALGLEPGETLEIVMPQFHRVDGRVISYFPTTPEEYAALKELDSDSLRKIGCQIWDEDGGKIHWLYPEEWYDHIPNGTEVVSISGKVEAFKRGETDNDIRFGALAYGFVQSAH